MMLQNLAPQECAVDVHVYFSRSDAFVAEHLLNGPEICPAFQQMSGK
jgi:hypothetical protein